MKIGVLYIMIGLSILLAFTSSCRDVKKMPVFGSTTNHTDGDDVLTPEEQELVGLAVADYIANNGNSMKYHKAVFDFDNRKWQDKFNRLQSEQIVRLNNELKGRNYQAIKLELLPGVVGGDVWYFVDLDTRKIITLYGEK